MRAIGTQVSDIRGCVWVWLHSLSSLPFTVICLHMYVSEWLYVCTYRVWHRVSAQQTFVAQKNYK